MNKPNPNTAAAADLGAVMEQMWGPMQQLLGMTTANQQTVPAAPKIEVAAAPNGPAAPTV